MIGSWKEGQHGSYIRDYWRGKLYCKGDRVKRERSREGDGRGAEEWRRESGKIGSQARQLLLNDNNGTCERVGKSVKSRQWSEAGLCPSDPITPILFDRSHPPRYLLMNRCTDLSLGSTSPVFNIPGTSFAEYPDHLVSPMYRPLPDFTRTKVRLT